MKISLYQEHWKREIRRERKERTRRINALVDKAKVVIERCKQGLIALGAERIILFGSFAQGSYHLIDEDSDIDIAVSGLKSGYFNTLRILEEVSEGIPIDLIIL